MDFIILTDLLRVVRDIAVIVLAAETIIIGLVVLVALIQVWKLVGAVRKHLDRLVGQASEVLGTTADTARNVRGTTSFVADQAARPIIEVLSILNAARQFARAAFSSEHGNGRRPEH